MVAIGNSSVFLDPQEHRFYNGHMYNVTFAQGIIYGVALPTSAFIGILLNFIIILALFKDKVSSSLHLLLHCLAFYDVGVSLFSVSLYTLPVWSSYFMAPETYLTTIHPYLVPYLIPILHMAITGSDYLNLATAVERCLATGWEFRENKKADHHLGCPTGSTKGYIIKIFLLTVLFNIPAFFELTTDDGGAVVPTALRSHKVYRTMYRLMAEFLIFKVTPWFTFLILWLRLGHRVSYYTQKRSVRRTLSVKQFNEIRDTRLVLGIIALFYVTNILPFYISFCHIMSYHVEDLVMYLASLSLVFNSAFKLVVYTCLSKRFRSALSRLCRQ